MNRFACIYVGPNRVDLITAQRGQNRKVKILDHAFYPLDLDYEIYQNGIISKQSSQTLERVVEEYIRLSNENLPDQIDIVFCKEIKKAENFLFIYYRIKQLGEGCNLRILSDEEEMALFCSTVKLLVSEVEDIETADMLFAEISSESIDFALTNEGIIDYTEKIPYGYVKLVEIVESITSRRTHYSKLLGEIIDNKLRLAVRHINGRELKFLTLTTKDAKTLSEIMECEIKGEVYVLKKEAIDELHKQIKDLTPEQLKTLYPKLTEPETLTIQSTVIVARRLLQSTHKEEIILIQRNLAETLVQLEFKVTKRKEIKNWLDEGTIKSAIALAERYNVDQEHASLVEQYSLRIFDSLKKKFNMSKKTRRYVRLASRLLDVGQYGGEEGQSHAVEEIILREELVGLNKQGRKIIARICRNTKINDYEKTRQNFEFSMEEALLISQCTAIIKASAALDQSRRSKISKLQCSLKEEDFIIKITTSHNTQLEDYYFTRDKIWLERVFEISPQLKVKRIKV